MNDSTIAFRAKEQLGKFLGKVFTHFSRPRQKFLADMLYGIQASGDTRIPRGAADPPKAVARGVLSSVMRAINDDSGKCHAVEKRLSRNVADATIGDDIDKASSRPVRSSSGTTRSSSSTRPRSARSSDSRWNT